MAGKNQNFHCETFSETALCTKDSIAQSLHFIDFRMFRLHAVCALVVDRSTDAIGREIMTFPVGKRSATDRLVAKGKRFAISRWEIVFGTAPIDLCFCWHR